MTIDSDQPYIDKIIAGDSKTFAVLVNRYKDLVYTLALRMLKHKEEAEEVSQDTFIKVYKSLNKFKGDSKFSTWIYKVTYNTCLDRIKKNKQTQKTVTIDEFTEYSIKPINNALDYLESQERKQALKKCLEFLSPEDSALLNLFYFEELSLEEISKITSVSSNTLKVKLHRSRKRLLTIVKQQLEPEIIEFYERANG